MRFPEQVALVTGAGSGLGEAAAYALAREGAKVGCLSRDPEEIGQIVSHIEKQVGEALGLQADVSQPDQMQSATNQIIDKWGRLDIVFANAGINGVWAPIEELTPEDWDKTLSINLKGTFLTIKYAVPHLKKQGGSVIINSSVNGTRIFSNTGATAYSSSKAGQLAMGQMLAVELAKWKVRVNVICPGAFESEISENTQQRNLEQVKVPAEFPEGEIPLTGKEPGKPEQVADLVVFLASDESSHITGTPIWIDGAESLLRG
jgi:NAD(P)-dependent dehydrogenase (short-subunit alcohol dehydrogenase family)